MPISFANSLMVTLAGKPRDASFTLGLPTRRCGDCAGSSGVEFAVGLGGSRRFVRV